MSSIEAESAVRTKRRQSLYKQQNQLQISEKKKNYRENNRDIIEKYNNENKEKIREKQKNYNRENKEKIQEKQEKYNRENKDKIRGKQHEYDCKNKNNRAKQNKYNQKNKGKIQEKQLKYDCENQERIREKQQKYDSNKREKVDENARLKKFKIAVRNGPIYPCSSCHRLLYSNGVRLVTKKFKEKVNAHAHFYDSMVQEIPACDGSIYLCHTCHRSLFQIQFPTMSIKNGLLTDETPTALNLSELLIAKNIMFFKLFKLPKTRWAGMRDKLVNVPINDDDLINTLSIYRGHQIKPAFSLSKGKLSTKTLFWKHTLIQQNWSRRSMY